ncbi:MAG TPA: DUF4397 domain-containing protein, partial [Phototrophicaceae bacterium]|nr:DUF4397 domain-containing protein [Phototrophicaceae bacterium]
MFKYGLLKTWLVCLLVLMSLSISVVATVAAQETGRVRFAHFGVDAGSLIVYSNGTAFSASDNDQPSVFEYRTVTDYLELPAETYSIVIANLGGTLDEALLGPVDMEIEAGHSYTSIVYGQIADASLTLKNIDDTTELVNYKMEDAVAPVMLFQGISEVPAVDIYAAGEPFLDNIPFGDIRIIDFPLSVVPITITVHGDKDTVVLQEDFFGVPNTLALA